MDGRITESKYRSSFPIQQYLDQFYPDGKTNTTGQFVASCPRCSAAGMNGAGKFYYDTRKMKGLCQRCHVGGDSGGLGSLAGLIMFTEGLDDYGAALERLKAYAVVDDIVGMALSEIGLFRNNIKAEIKEEDYWNVPINDDIPRVKDADMIKVEKFFSRRSNPMTIRITELFPVYFSDADFLKDRVIFKINTNNSYAWLAYAMKKNMLPKTLNPRGSVLSYMLGGYNYFKKDEKPLIIVEGVFDMFRCILRGYNTVCSFSDKLSARQIALINATNATEIILCYDSEIGGYGWKGMWKMVRKWARGISKPISLMFLPLEGREKSDPDDVSKRGFDKAYAERKVVK